MGKTAKKKERNEKCKGKKEKQIGNTKILPIMKTKKVKEKCEDKGNEGENNNNNARKEKKSKS